MTVLLVLLGGLVGAPARFVTDVAVQRRHSSPFPWGILLVNAVGSLLLGLVAGASAVGDLPEWVLTLVGTGFCGALTTFSTFSLNTYLLLTQGHRRLAVANVTVSLAVGLAAVSLGWWLAAR